MAETPLAFAVFAAGVKTAELISRPTLVVRRAGFLTVDGRRIGWHPAGTKLPVERGAIVAWRPGEARAA